MEMYLPEILFGGFMLLLLLGAPITVALGGAAMGAYMALDKDPIALVQIAFNSVGSFPLMALPAFVLAGALMEAAGISRRLVDIAETMAGPITGGLGVATVLACLFFGAISGSGPATTAAVGMLMIPAMTKRKLRSCLCLGGDCCLGRAGDHYSALDSDGDLRHCGAGHGAAS